MFPVQHQVAVLMRSHESHDFMLLYKYESKWMLAHSRDVCTNTHVHPDLQACMESIGVNLQLSSMWRGLYLDWIFDVKVMRAFWKRKKNTKVAVQGQIYTEGYLSISVISGLTYSSALGIHKDIGTDLKGGNAVGKGWAAVQFGSKDLYIWHGSVFTQTNFVLINIWGNDTKWTNFH